jgi:hypothetical protein
MADWLDSLSDEDRQEWDRFVEHFRRDTLEKIAGSRATISIVPAGGELDVKFAVELGASIMLNKPIMAIAHSEDDVPEKLRKVVDEVFVLGPGEKPDEFFETLIGKMRVASAIDRFFKSLDKPPPDQLWVNAERTILVRFWGSGEGKEVALRDSSDHVWGPPIPIKETT